MTDIAFVTDHSEQALALLIDQFKGLPRLSGLVTAFINRVQELELVAWDVTNKRLLDYTALDGTTSNAVGAQLDAIGRLVGQKRLGQNDATYLIYIRARIALNNSRGRRGDVSRLFALLEPASFSYTEYYPAVVVVEYVTPPTAAPAILSDLARQVVSAGVRLFLIAQAQSDGFLLGDDTAGGTVDAVHGLSSESEASGGYLAGIW